MKTRRLAQLLPLALTFAAGALAAPTPFASCPTEAFVTRGTNTTSINLYSLSLVQGDMTLQGTGTPVLPTDINAIGFRQTDGLIYGWGNGLTPPRLVQVGQNGAYATPFTTVPTGITSGSTFYIGDVQPSTGYYVGATSNVLYFIDVTTNSLVRTVGLSVSNILKNSTDIAFNPSDGLIYSVDKISGKIIRINPQTGASAYQDVYKQNIDGSIDKTTTILPLNDPTEGGFGAIFFDSLGTMYLYKSGGGNPSATYGSLYRVYNPSSTSPSYSRGTNTLVANNLDGARCPTAPPPYGSVQINKTITGTKLDGTTPIDGNSITSPLTFNYTMNCTVPASSAAGSVTVAAGSTTGTATITSGIPVGAAGCTVKEDTATLPAAPTGYAWGIPTYTQPTDFVAGTGTQATITNPLTLTQGTLSVTKTTPTTYITYEKQADGSFKPNPASITYTITVTASGAAANSVVVTDALPAGLSNVTVQQGTTAVALTDSAGTSLSQPLTGPTTANQVIQWNAGGVAVGSTVTYTVSATLPSAATLEAAQPQGNLTNSVSAKGSNTGTATATATSQSIYTRLFKQVHDLGAAATASTPAVPASTPAWSSAGSGLPGDVLEYCIDFANYGSTALANYGLADHVPDNTTFMEGSILVKSGTMSTTPTAVYVGATSAYDSSSKAVTANIGTLAAGATGSLCFRTKIN